MLTDLMLLRVPRWKLRWHARNWIRHRWREVNFHLLLFLLPVIKLFCPALTVVHGCLRVRVLHADGTVSDYGVVGRHLVTTAGKNAVASAFNNVMEPETFKFAGYGTGTNAANVADTTLQTELTTQYATDNVRPTGSQANSTNTYTTIATLAPDSGGTIAVTEWGLFTQAATGGGTLLDRQVFSAVNLVAGSDSLQTTYVLTIS